jgi:putative ubiquitin-RnfH superfamily antitoxin RatB of RatAB toxin-antitoxin module
MLSVSGQICFMADPKIISVEVAYASTDGQALISLHVPAGSTVMSAVRLSAIEDQFPEVDFESAAKGIFSKPTVNDFVLSDLDRVEIYRELVVDPREARRQRARRAAKN